MFDTNNHILCTTYWGTAAILMQEAALKRNPPDMIESILYSLLHPNGKASDANDTILDSLSNTAG